MSYSHFPQNNPQPESSVIRTQKRENDEKTQTLKFKKKTFVKTLKWFT